MEAKTETERLWRQQSAAFQALYTIEKDASWCMPAMHDSTPPRPTLPPPKAAHVDALLFRYQRAQQRNKPSFKPAPRPTGLQLMRERCAHHAWLMYRREASIVITVVLARTWHNFFITTYGLLGPREDDLMTCGDCYWYVLAVVLSGATLLVCTAGLRGQATELLAPVCGMLSGWAFKHLVDTCTIDGQGGSDTPISTELLFAAGCTTVSWLLMYAAHFLKIHGRVVGSATAEAFAARVSVLLSNACGLGCAAAWFYVLQAVTSLHEYTFFVAAGACGGANSTQASPHTVLELPSPLTMSAMFAASTTTLCAQLSEQIFRQRAADAGEMERLSSLRIQAQLRGWLARRRRRAAGVAAGSSLDLAAVRAAKVVEMAQQQGRKTHRRRVRSGHVASGLGPGPAHALSCNSRAPPQGPSHSIHCALPNSAFGRMCLTLTRHLTSPSP